MRREEWQRKAAALFFEGIPTSRALLPRLLPRLWILEQVQHRGHATQQCATCRFISWPGL